MKVKNIITISLTVFVLLLTAIIVIFRVSGVKLNVFTYHKESIENYTVAYKGSGKEVRKITIKANGKKISSLPFYSSSDIFTDEYSISLIDINFDGVNDLILPSSFDDDKDIHYSAYIFDGSGFIYFEDLADLPNISDLNADNETFFTTATSKIYVEEPHPNSPEKYELRQERTKYSLIDGKPTAIIQKAITYYSESDIYCYSVYEYSDDYKKLTYVVEKWVSPAKIDNYSIDFE